MKVAIIYTGEIRTIEKVYKKFKENCLWNPLYHVYAVLQNENKEIEEKIKEEFGEQLKYFTWFNKYDGTFHSLKECLVNNMKIGDNWKQYLAYNSGSMIEYYQMFMAYLAIVKYEQEIKEKYDYIVRIRCDCMIVGKLDLNCMNLSKEELYKLYCSIEIENKEAKINMLINSLIDSNRWRYTSDTTIYNNYFSKLESFDDVYNYYKQGKFLLTFRKNIFYLIKREYFYSIASLGVTYGTYIDFSNDYWFDAESQLKTCCLFNEIDYYSSETEFEGASLYKYNTNNYFDENGELKNREDLLFFLVRN